MRSIRHSGRHAAVLVAGLAVAGGLLAAGCANPKSEANTATALNDAANEIGGLKSDFASLQAEVDSLRTVIAKQDTTISHLAAVANVPITR